MKNLAAIFLFGFALVALCGSSGGARQVQFTPQLVKVINTPNEGPFLPVANDPQHPIYVVVGSDKPSTRPTFEYKVDTFNPPVITYQTDPNPKLDFAKLQSSFESFLNTHSDWEVVSAPTSFALGPNLITFRRIK